MLARTLLDNHYRDFETLLMAIAGVLAQQVAGLPCDCLQVDEANIPGNPADAPLAANAINCVLDAFHGKRAVHLCFGNYGGQTIQKGEWRALDRLPEPAPRGPPRARNGAPSAGRSGAAERRGPADQDRHRRDRCEDQSHRNRRRKSPARSSAPKRSLGPGRVGWIHPDCGFWMLKRSIADRKIAALAAGRDLYLGSA